MEEYSDVKVCIVEDDQLIREMYQLALENDGFRVFIASDGEEGLEVIRANKPDIALIDILMPVMDGITLMQKMDEDPELRNIPVIVISNNKDQSTIEKTKKSRFYLLKAFYTPKKVVGLVREVLSHKGGY